MRNWRSLYAAAAVAGMVLATWSAQAQESKATKAPAKTTASACKGLDQAACGANTACQWIAPKSGKQKPYCRLKPKGKTAAPKQTPATK